MVSSRKPALALPVLGLLLCAVQETQPPGRLPLLLRTGELVLEGLHDKEARRQVPFLEVIV